MCSPAHHSGPGSSTSVASRALAFCALFALGLACSDPAAELQDGGLQDAPAPDQGQDGQREGPPPELGPPPDAAQPDPGLNLGPGVTVWPSAPQPGQPVTIRYEGWLADQPELTLHYGFNGWNALAGSALAAAEDGTGNTNFFATLPLTPLTGGQGFEVTLPLPAGARALHFVFFSGSATERQWDNNAGQDYNLGVIFPLIGPYVTLDPAGDPARRVIVNFHTSAPCRGQVAYGTSPQLGALSEEPAPSRSHALVLAGLSPQTRYHYQVSCGPRGPTPLATLQTAPAQPTALTLLALADVQENGESARWRATVQEILSNHSDAALLLIAGDLAWNDSPGLWWTFFDEARPLFASVPLMAAPGNHDTPSVNSNPDTASFDRFFLSKGPQSAYSFRYGEAAFLALNSERPDGFAAGGLQRNWAAQTLATLLASPDPPRWVLVFWHIPPYNAGSRHYAQQGAFRDLTALFAGKVDWQLSGHEHLYQRSKPLRYNALLAPSGRYGTGPEDGVGYLVLPPASAWPNDQLIPLADPKGYYRDRLLYPPPPATQDQVPSQIGFARLSLVGPSFELTTYGLGHPGAPQPAHPVDSLSYSK